MSANNVISTEEVPYISLKHGGLGGQARASPKSFDLRDVVSSGSLAFQAIGDDGDCLPLGDLAAPGMNIHVFMVELCYCFLFTFFLATLLSRLGGLYRGGIQADFMARVCGGGSPHQENKNCCLGW